MIKVILNINKTRDSIKFNKDLWYINDDDISLLEIQEAADKMITNTSLPLLRLGQRLYKQNSKNVLYWHVNSKYRHHHRRLNNWYHHHKPRTVISFNKNHTTLPRLSLSTSIIPLYPTFLTLFCILNSTPLISHCPQMQLFHTRPLISHPFNSARPIPLYYTNHTLTHPFRSTPPISYYSAHPTLPNPPHTAPSNMQKSTKIQTRIKKHPRQLHRLDILLYRHDLRSDGGGGSIIFNK